MSVAMILWILLVVFLNTSSEPSLVVLEQLFSCPWTILLRERHSLFCTDELMPSSSAWATSLHRAVFRFPIENSEF